MVAIFVGNISSYNAKLLPVKSMASSKANSANISLHYISVVGITIGTTISYLKEKNRVKKSNESPSLQK
jgi:hypothetical protein